MSEKAFIEWSYVDHWVESIIKQINDRELEFDTIVGIGRGGLIPSTMISYKLKCAHLQNFGITTRHAEDTIINQRPSLSGNVLIVDDINDSGKTFEIVDSLINNDKRYKNIKSLTYCSLIKRYTSTFNKDTIEAIQTKLDDWFIFPWDK
jgi:hypoxanthine phosphoribosyltransferase